MFLPRIGKCGAVHYMSLQSIEDPKENKFNNDMFAFYLIDI